jgi:hypothetical protein
MAVVVVVVVVAVNNIVSLELLLYVIFQVGSMPSSEALP